MKTYLVAGLMGLSLFSMANSALAACSVNAQGYKTCRRPQLAGDRCCTYDPSGKLLGCKYIPVEEGFSLFQEENVDEEQASYGGACCSQLPNDPSCFKGC